ncbi:MULTISPECIES: hypothetical protein [unclassified Rhodococcus (in: high G+C Gram-positive bacteria)]|nr:MULTISPECIES: hypothetical protein [unclassified Rhodococcus (in: high G+C Gram-positive bacteria)]
MENLVPWTTYTVQQECSVITIDEEALAEPVVSENGDLRDAFGS